MSLLLEALKRAALEKQQRGESEKSSLNASSVSDLDSEIETNTIPESESSLELDRIEEKLKPTSEHEFEELEVGEFLDLNFDETETLDLALPENEIEESTDSFELDLISDDGELKQELDGKAATLLALEEAKQKSEREKKARDYERDQARIAQEQALKEQAELKRLAEEAEKVELARIQEENRLEEEQERLKAKNLSALQDILKSGERVDQQAKRRSLVLYGALLFTALLSIGVYYFFILKGAESHLIKEPGTNLVIVDEPLESDEQIDVEASAENTLDELAAAPLKGDLSLVADDSVLITNAGLETKEVTARTPGYALPEEGDFVNQLAKIENPIESMQLESEVTRADVPPTAKFYLRGMRGIGNETVLSESKDDEQLEKVVIHQTNRPLPIARMVNDAYSQYQFGNYNLAQSLYWKVLNSEPKNKDAILGLAAIATLQNRYQEALDLYHQILAEAPDDEYARAGILSLTQGQSSIGDLQSELDDLLEVHPNTANLHFLKGANHANGKRWKLAQTSFFNAYINDSSNANYAYNLAISLDHLNQPNEALNFYRRALLLSAQKPAGFSVEVIEQRISSLEMVSK